MTSFFVSGWCDGLGTLSTGIFLITMLFRLLRSRFCWSWLFGSFGSNLALSFIDRWFGSYPQDDACVCDCFASPPQPSLCAQTQTATRDKFAVDSCPPVGIGSVPIGNSRLMPTGSTDPLATSSHSELLHSTIRSSHWVVDGYSLIVTAVLWWHRRPRRL